MFHYANYPNIEVAGTLPPAKDLIACIPGRDISTDRIVNGLLWHDAIAAFVAFHLNASLLTVDELVEELTNGGYQGKRDDCHSCPLAKMYLDKWGILLQQRGMLLYGRTVVQMMPQEFTLEVTGRWGSETEKYGLRFTINPFLSSNQRQFISAFDHGEVPELDALLGTDQTP